MFCKNMWRSDSILNNQIRQIFKGALVKFCEMTLKLPQSNQKPLFNCMKLVIITAKCDVCLFLHKMRYKMV